MRKWSSYAVKLKTYIVLAISKRSSQSGLHHYTLDRYCHVLKYVRILVSKYKITIPSCLRMRLLSANACVA